MGHLLIVDNDERIVELTAWFLQRFGHEVDTAFSYAAAREQLRERRPELMLADLDLGVESGREELPRLQAEGLLPPTLVVSGFLDAELERELTALPGVHGTLAKPVDLDALQARVLECLAATAAVEQAPPAALVVDAAPAAPVEPPEDDDGWVEIVPLRADVTPATEIPAPSPLAPEAPAAAAVPAPPASPPATMPGARTEGTGL